MEKEVIGLVVTVIPQFQYVYAFCLKLEINLVQKGQYIQNIF